MPTPLSGETLRHLGARRPLTIDDLTLMITSNRDYERISFPTRHCEAGMQGVQGLHKAGYGTPLTLIGDKAADALQAAYFLGSLCAERAQLLAEIFKPGDNIAKRPDRGQRKRDASTRVIRAKRESSGAVSRPTHHQARPSLRDSTGWGLTAQLHQVLRGHHALQTAAQIRAALAHQTQCR